MPRKAKITAVPIDVQPDQTLEQVDDPEPKTDAEKMTDVINEVNVTETAFVKRSRFTRYPSRTHSS